MKSINRTEPIRGDLQVVIDGPISAVFLFVCLILVVGQLHVRWPGKRALLPDGPPVMEG